MVFFSNLNLGSDYTLKWKLWVSVVYGSMNVFPGNICAERCLSPLFEPDLVNRPLVRFGVIFFSSYFALCLVCRISAVAHHRDKSDKLLSVDTHPQTTSDLLEHLEMYGDTVFFLGEERSPRKNRKKKPPRQANTQEGKSMHVAFSSSLPVAIANWRANKRCLEKRVTKNVHTTMRIASRWKWGTHNSILGEHFTETTLTQNWTRGSRQVLPCCSPQGLWT